MPSMLFVLNLSTNLRLLINKKAGDMTLFPVLNIDRGRRRRGDLVTAGHRANPISKEQVILRSQTTDTRFRDRSVQTAQGNISNLHITDLMVQLLLKLKGM